MCHKSKKHAIIWKERDKTTKISIMGKNEIKQLISLVSLLAEIKLKANFSRFSTDDRVIKEVALTVPNPTMLHVEPSAAIT